MNQEIIKQIKRKILLNPGPATTGQNVKNALLVEDICPREKEFGILVERVREKAKDIVHGKDQYQTVLIGGPGTAAIETCLTSCVNQGESILIISNGAYGKRMKEICEVYGIANNCLQFAWGDPIDMQIVKTYLKVNRGVDRVMAFVHHETTVGILNPLDKLFEIGHQNGLRILVDAMSSYAGLPIDLQITEVDYLISSSNKALQGMAGIGIIVVKDQTLKEIKEYKKRNYVFNLYRNFIHQKEKKQFLFTPPVQILYALDRAFDDYLQEGGEARYERYCNLYEVLCQGMENLGFSYLLDKKFHSKLLTAFLEPRHPNYSFDSMHDYLYALGITIYPGKNAKKDTFRIANIGDLHVEDIEFFLHSMNKYLIESSINYVN